MNSRSSRRMITLRADMLDAEPFIQRRHEEEAQEAHRESQKHCGEYRVTQGQGASGSQEGPGTFHSVRTMRHVLRVLLLTFPDFRNVTAVANQVYSLEERSKLHRALRADEINGDLEGFIQSITWHVSDLQVRSLPIAAPDFTR